MGALLFGGYIKARDSWKLPHRQCMYYAVMRSPGGGDGLLVSGWRSRAQASELDRREGFCYRVVIGFGGRRRQNNELAVSR